MDPVHGSAWEIALCPPYVGTFGAGESGLTVTIVQENDKPVQPRTEQLANALSGEDAKAVVARGRVQFNAHIDKDSGHLFVHWETLRADH